MFNREVHWYNIVEILFPIYIVTVPVWMEPLSGANPGYLANASDPLFFFTAFLQIPLLGVIMYLVLRFVFKYKDSRLKFMNHFLPVLLASLFSTALFATYGKDMPEDSPWLTYRLFLITVPTLTYIFVGFYAGFKVNIPYLNQFENLANQVQNGNLDAKMENGIVLKDGVFGPIAVFVNSTLDSLSSNIAKIEFFNSKMSDSSTELISNIDTLSVATKEVDETTSMMAKGAMSQATLMNSTLEQVRETSLLLEQVVSDIQDKTNLVSQIALQTNILALNAGIEASRAGDYGRGFAVVAENVRRLSEESKSAVEQISSVVNQVVEFNNVSFNAIESEIENISSISEETAASAEEVAAIMGEFREVINSLLNTTGEMKTSLSQQ